MCLEQAWRGNLGEISRHLRGTKLEQVTADESLMTDDYPILPVRRRFWERVLRTIDTTGTVSQLRSQLRVVHEAVLATVDLPLGHVVGGDFLYDQIAASLISTAQLPKEVYENVQRFAAGDASARLKGKLLKLTPATEQGRDAQRSMESRERNAENELKDLLDRLFAGARVFQAGGQEVTEGNELSDRINRAAKASAIRLYNQFDVADNCSSPMSSTSPFPSARSTTKPN